jgi:hypothetical protein
MSNSYGEIKGLGPAWACDKHGDPGHNKQLCITCLGNFMRTNDNNDNNKGDATK